MAKISAYIHQGGVMTSGVYKVLKQCIFCKKVFYAKSNKRRCCYDEECEKMRKLSYAQRAQKRFRASGAESIADFYAERKRPSALMQKEPHMKRICLKCDRKFVARGRFNRICSVCTKWNNTILSGKEYGDLIETSI